MSDRDLSTSFAYHQASLEAPAINPPESLPGLPLVGQISFINALPVVLPLELGAVPLAARSVAAPPGTLNGWFREKRLDAGAMSAFFYLEHFRELQLIDGLAISSRGPVGSVLFFSAKEASELNGAEVGVPDSSASSINLLRILLKLCHGVDVTLVPYCEPDFAAADRGGLLLFGDKALLADADLSTRYNRIDLGHWWHRLTGLPMVYGVWGAQKDFVRDNSRAFEQIGAALVESRDQGLTTLFPEVLAEAASRTKLTAARLEQYYRRDLDFSFRGEHREGLKLYEALCRKYGYIGR